MECYFTQLLLCPLATLMCNNVYNQQGLFTPFFMNYWRQHGFVVLCSVQLTPSPPDVTRSDGVKLTILGSLGDRFQTNMGYLLQSELLAASWFCGTL